MTRRLQGLCLVFLGGFLGWLAGVDLSLLPRAPESSFAAWGFIGMKLLFALLAIFVGICFIFDLPSWGSSEKEQDHDS